MHNIIVKSKPFIFILSIFCTMNMVVGCGGGKSKEDVSLPITDIEAPVITLTGNKNLSVPHNGFYDELGAIAVDNIDGDVSVVVSGDVDVTNIGTYVINYSATDMAGNISNLERIITVSDMSAPEISINGDNDIFIALYTDYFDAGAEGNDNYDSEIFIIKEGVVDTSTIGEYTISYSAEDSMGNIATAHRSVTVLDVNCSTKSEWDYSIDRLLNPYSINDFLAIISACERNYDIETLVIEDLANIVWYAIDEYRIDFDNTGQHAVITKAGNDIEYGTLDDSVYYSKNSIISGNIIQMEISNEEGGDIIRFDLISVLDELDWNGIRVKKTQYIYELYDSEQSDKTYLDRSHRGGEVFMNYFAVGEDIRWDDFIVD